LDAISVVFFLEGNPKQFENTFCLITWLSLVYRPSNRWVMRDTHGEQPRSQRELGDYCRRQLVCTSTFTLKSNDFYLPEVYFCN